MVKKSQPVEIGGVRYVDEAHHIEETTELLARIKELEKLCNDGEANEMGYATELQTANQCLAEVARALEAKGVPMAHCPPMMYPEAVHNLAVWSARAARDCWHEHDQWHGADTQAFARCMTDSVRRLADEAAQRFDKERRPGGPPNA